MVMPVKFWISICLSLIVAAGCAAMTGCGGSAPAVGEQGATFYLQANVLRDTSGAPRGVRLIWPLVAGPDVAGYHIYCSPEPIPDAARGDDSFWLTIITSPLVSQPTPPASTVQADHLFAAVIGETWYYRLTTVDTGGSESRLSGETAVTISDFNILNIDPLSAGVNRDVIVSGEYFGSYDEAVDDLQFTGVNWVPGIGFEPAMLSAPIVSWTPGEIVSRVPLGATSGEVDVTVDLATKSSTQVFTNSDPYITDISVLSGVAGDQVTLLGNNFGPGFDAGHRVVIGSTLLLSANDYVSYTNTEIVFIIPDGPLGSQSVRVRVGSVDSNEAFLDIQQAPGPVWEHTWGEIGNEAAQAVVTDSVGDVYLGGLSTSYHEPYSDALLMKYSASGGFRWARVWDNTDRGRIADRIETGADLCISDADDLYLAGTAHDENSRQCVLLLKFNSAGDFQYARTWTTANVDSSAAQAICTDNSYLYIAGMAKIFDISAALLLKYGLDGTFVDSYWWVVDRETVANDIAVDANGDLLVTGYAGDAAAGLYDVYLAKLDSNFTFLWADYWGEAGIDIGSGLYVTDTNDILVVGSTSSFGNSAQPLLVVYGTDGKVQGGYYWPVPDSSSFLTINEAASGKFYCVGTGKAQSAIIYYALLGDAASGFGADEFRAYAHPLTQPNALNGWVSSADDLFICGVAVRRGAVWSDLDVFTTPAPGLTAGEDTPFAPLDGTSSTVNGTTTNVMGIENTGGGADDALIIKYNPE